MSIFKFTLILYLGSIVARSKLNRFGGNLLERWNMWFNSIIREKSYQSSLKHLNIKFNFNYNLFFYFSFNKGIAWLSSVRVLRCGIKFYNEQNPINLYKNNFLNLIIKLKSIFLN